MAAAFIHARRAETGGSLWAAGSVWGVAAVCAVWVASSAPSSAATQRHVAPAPGPTMAAVVRPRSTRIRAARPGARSFALWASGAPASLPAPGITRRPIAPPTGASAVAAGLAGAVGAAAAALVALGRRSRPSPGALHACTAGPEVGRRTLLAGALLVGGGAAAVPAVAADATTVGAYLPPFGKDNLFLFVPSPTETPAIRAGTIDPRDPYTFALPGGWKRQTVSNTISGNFCQPKCGEPWTEVIFAGPEGRLQVCAGPLEKLTTTSRAKVTDLGPPEQLISAIGSYMTGTYIDEESVLKAEVKTVNGSTYYTYELYADYGTLPPHILASVTTKDDVILIFVINATDKQWNASKGTLQAIADSFQRDAAGRK